MSKRPTGQSEARRLRSSGGGEQFHKARPDEILAALEVVREAHKLFGKAAAVEIWRRQAVLPTPGKFADPPPSTPASATVRDFVAKRTSPKDGVQLNAQTFYRAYVEWTEAHGHRPVSQTAFGRALRSLGLRKVRSGCVSYLDIRLRIPRTPSVSRARPSDDPPKSNMSRRVRRVGK
ncbi:primase-like DNA-binding domain-containing protein [Methyloceanibacter caenitepidi]|uniref:primase-like DNA-binding domain-containing protein n=1 Tax=Methyloceanibacter caenitepidi TaxID=1384459 RepID=UPI0005F09711